MVSVCSSPGLTTSSSGLERAASSQASWARKSPGTPRPGSASAGSHAPMRDLWGSRPSSVAPTQRLTRLAPRPPRPSSSSAGPGRAAEPGGQLPQVLDQLWRLVDLEVDPQHEDSQGEPIQVIVARAVLAAR